MSPELTYIEQEPLSFGLEMRGKLTLTMIKILLLRLFPIELAAEIKILLLKLA
jgi:hypothetical protein